MPEYQVLLRRRAEKQLDRVAYADHPRIVGAISHTRQSNPDWGCSVITKSPARMTRSSGLERKRRAL